MRSVDRHLVDGAVPVEGATHLMADIQHLGRSSERGGAIGLPVQVIVDIGVEHGGRAIVLDDPHHVIPLAGDDVGGSVDDRSAPEAASASAGQIGSAGSVAKLKLEVVVPGRFIVDSHLISSATPGDFVAQDLLVRIDGREIDPGLESDRAGLIEDR